MNAPPRYPPALIRPDKSSATLKEAPWGGTRLALARDRLSEDPPIGESLEFSTLSGLESRALGFELSRVLEEPLPFVAKRIDTAAPLSIQVHPEGDSTTGRIGKEEAWVILDAVEGASVLAGVAGHMNDAALQRAMHHAIEEPRQGRVLSDALQRIPVVRGMVILVPAGTVHSIGSGILLAEIQQPVDATFRLFDYGSARAIHPKSARAAWRIEARPQVWRPEEPTRSIDGHHVSLQIQTAGDIVVRDDLMPRLLVAVGDGIRVSVDGADDVELAHGDLLLQTRGVLRVHVEGTAILVTGSVRHSHGGSPAKLISARRRPRDG